ncbi:MAG: hypothetical protein IK115_00310 [Lachnospiraceae bacterium]|nr:hypothetical protein [Lachnospiraceae bacterium]
MIMKKGRQLLLSIIILLIALIYSGVLILGRIGVVKSNVAVISGSYGDQFAKDNKLNVVELADSQKGYFDQHYELFDYNIDGGTISLERYDGKSRELIIPAKINGVSVTTISGNMIEGLNGVEKLYISPAIREISGEPVEKPLICCTEDNRFYKENADVGWKFELIYDSDFINYDLGDIPFEYNIKADGAEITAWHGSDEILVIPAYINGYPVTEVSMNILGTADITVIPETVKSISGEVKRFVFPVTLAIELIATVAAFLIALICINVLLPRYRKGNEEYVLNGGQMVLAIAYVLLQTIFSIYAINSKGFSPYIALIVSLIIFVVFMVLMFAGGIGREHAKAVDAKIERKTEKMKSIKYMCKGMADNVKDEELRKKVQQLEEEIRYSDPSSRSDLEEMENEIESLLAELLGVIAKKDNDSVIDITDRLTEIVKKRNDKCKVGK